MKCLECGTLLIGKQSKYCSRLCKNTYNNINYQSYLAQQKRGRERKLRLIALKSRCCEFCGYAKNYAALEFHHQVAPKKQFQLDLRSLPNRKWDEVVKETDKCKLLCSNCHTELHNPNCVME